MGRQELKNPSKSEQPAVAYTCLGKICIGESDVEVGTHPATFKII